MAKPEIPKRMAARIKSAQQAVKAQRRWILGAEKNYEQALARVEEYESDPWGFAARYYRNHEPDSYPVQTNIQTNRDRIARHEWRKDERIAELAELEATLMRIEAEVLVAVTNMRSTKGRVPWPRKLPSWDKFKEAFEAQMEREDERWRIKKATDDVRFEAQIAREEAKLEESQKKSAAIMIRSIEKMSPTEYAEYRAWADYISEGLRSGQFTTANILDMMRKRAVH